MNLHIHHHTQYVFDAPVRLHPHLIRMFPRRTAHARLLHSKVTISPTPAGSNWLEDSFGNQILQTWFTGETTQVNIQTDIKLVSLPFESWNFLFFPLESSSLSWYPDHQWSTELTPFLAPILLPKDLHSWLKTLINEHESPSAFLLALCNLIQQQFSFQSRIEGNALKPGQTWEMKKGACRDLSWMMIHMLRSLNFPARFVSGYHADPQIPEHDLHAWVEVYLPGGGWIGLDPSLGKAVDQNYIPLAVGDFPKATLPLEGSYSGEGKANLRTSLSLDTQ